MFSCKDSSIPVAPINSNFTYPLSVGNAWSYNASAVYSNISPDSIKYMLNDYSMDLEVSVTKKTFIDTNEVYEIKEVSKVIPNAFAYYSNKKEGFLKYAYSNSPAKILPKTGVNKKFLFNGIYFNNISEFLKNLEKINSAAKTFNDSILYLDPPRVIYSYPLEVGKEWNFSTPYLKMTKQIVGKETINTSFGNYSCFKIRWKYDLNSDGIVDDNLIYYEYLSSKGILKRTLILKNFTVSTFTNPSGIGSADVKYEENLTGINF